MSVLETHWATQDLEIAEDEKLSHSFTFTNKATGLPLDISTYDFYFKAEAEWTTDVITVAPGAMTKSNSGRGSIDKLTVPFSTSDTAVTPGRYTYDLVVDTGSEELVWLKGTLTVSAKNAVVA